MKYSPVFLSGAIVSSSLFLLPITASAQLLPDGTTGTNILSDQMVRGSLAEYITGGDSLNGNLLHSFSDFNVDAGQRVYFENPAAIDNIITRVTGLNGSDIFGTLGVDGAANLFLINPNGITFGTDASLDIAGSLLATTAKEILTENGFINVSTASNDALLTVNPAALFSNGLRDYLGDVANSGDLAVGTGQTLMLQGNNVSHSGLLTAAEGTVNLFGNDVLLDGGSVDVSGATGGEIYILGANSVAVSRDSLLDASGAINGGFVETSAPDVDIYGGSVKTLGNLGDTGTWLLDPQNILIDDTYRDGIIIPGLTSNNVEISTDLAGSDAGDITLDSDITFTDNSNSLTLTGRRFNLTSGSFNLAGDLIFNLNQVNPETNAPSSSINNAMNSIGNVIGERIINLGDGTFAGETIEIDKDVTIQALNPAVIKTDDNGVAIEVTPSVFLDGENTRQVVDITGGNTFYLNNIGISNGKSNTAAAGKVTVAGGIYNQAGKLIISNSTFFNNSSEGNLGRGGAIFNNSAEISTITNSIFSGNTAELGGALYSGSSGQFTISNSTFSNNSAEGNLGGGAIYNGSNELLTITNSVFSGNTANIAGAIYGGENKQLTISNSTFSNNSAQEIGGAIYNGGGSQSNIFTSSFSSNHADVSGGVIYNKGNVTVDSSTFSGNSSNLGGVFSSNSDGIVTFSQSTFSDNTATATGGVIYNGNGTINISNSTISKNKADFRAGGIYNNSTINISNSMISDNTAMSGSGGGIYNNADGEINISDSTISGNVATLSGGGVFNISKISFENAVFRQNKSADVTNTPGGVITLAGSHSLDDFVGEGGSFIVEAPVVMNADSLTLTNTLFNVQNKLNINSDKIFFNELLMETSEAPNTAINFNATDTIDIQNSIVSSSGRVLLLKFNSPLVTFANSDVVTYDLNTVKSGLLDITNTGTILLDSSTFITTSEPNSGTIGGNIKLTADRLQLNNFSLIDSSTYSEQNAGNIDIFAGDLSLNNASIIRSLTTNSGDAGNINLNISRDLDLTDRSIISTAATSQSSGNSGNIQIASPNSLANSLKLTGGSQLQALTEGNGKAGNINVYVNNDILISGASEINTGNNPLLFETLKASNTVIGISEQEDNGTISDSQALIESQFQINQSNNENVEFSTRIPYLSINSRGANINDVDIYQLEVKAGTRIILDVDTFNSTTTTYSTGEGNVRINHSAIDSQLTILDSNGDRLISNNNNSALLGGEGSNIDLDLNSLDPYIRFTFPETGTYYIEVTRVDGADLDIRDVNNANPILQTLSALSDVPYTLNISVEPPLIESISSLGNTVPSGIFSNTSGAGDAGIINLNSHTLKIEEGGEISAKSSASGDGGTLNINASQLVNLGNGTQNSAPVITVETSSSGKAGDININTPNFILSETARISATATETATNLDGGGSVNINANTMNLAGVVGVFAETQGQAPAGTLNLKPYQNNLDLDITLFTGSKISASTSGSGNGGDLIISAPRNLDVSGAGTLAASTSGSGKGGTVSITSENLNLSDGITISTVSTGAGKAGDIIFRIADNLILKDSFVLASTTPGSTGDGGTIDIDPNYTLLDNSTIAVSNLGTGKGGNLFLLSNILDLQNGSTISAETFNALGGNVELNIPRYLLLRNGSNITASAGSTDSVGNGGNITINSPFIIAFPNQNNNITANAFNGAGGNINISTNALFGIGFTGENIPVRNDITASSAFGLNGSVAITTPGIDPTSGLIQLPENLTDPSDQIDNSCQASEKSEFVVSGRGGIPNANIQSRNGELFLPDFRRDSSMGTSALSPSIETPIVETDLKIAQGFQRLPNGKIRLTSKAQARQNSLQHPNCAVY